MAKTIALGKNTICSFKSNKHLISCSNSCFWSILLYWNIFRTKVPEVLGEKNHCCKSKCRTKQLIDQLSKEMSFAQLWHMQPLLRAVPLLSNTRQYPLILHPSSLERRRGNSSKSMPKSLKILTHLSSCCARISQQRERRNAADLNMWKCFSVDPKVLWKLNQAYYWISFLYAVNY